MSQCPICRLEVIPVELSRHIVKEHPEKQWEELRDIFQYAAEKNSNG